jgi:hypothetical protein
MLVSESDSGTGAIGRSDPDARIVAVALVRFEAVA